VECTENGRDHYADEGDLSDAMLLIRLYLEGVRWQRHQTVDLFRFAINSKRLRQLCRNVEEISERLLPLLPRHGKWLRMLSRRTSSTMQQLTAALDLSAEKGERDFLRLLLARGFLCRGLVHGKMEYGDPEKKLRLKKRRLINSAEVVGDHALVIEKVPSPLLSEASLTTAMPFLTAMAKRIGIGTRPVNGTAPVAIEFFGDAELAARRQNAHASTPPAASTPNKTPTLMSSVPKMALLRKATNKSGAGPSATPAAAAASSSTSKQTGMSVGPTNTRKSSKGSKGSKGSNSSGPSASSSASSASSATDGRKPVRRGAFGAFLAMVEEDKKQMSGLASGVRRHKGKKEVEDGPPPLHPCALTLPPVCW
jgi:hypothetical protein